MPRKSAYYPIVIIAQRRRAIARRPHAAPPSKRDTGPRTNRDIRAEKVLLIDEHGEQVGVVEFQEALQKAKEANLDLIQVTEKVDPPVVRIGDYGKFQYQQEKKDRESRKNSGGELKEVRLGYNISPHDLETRAKQAIKFLNKGDRVRLTLPLRGRQKGKGDFATDKLKAFIEHLETEMPLKIEREVKREPRGLSAIIAKK